MALRLVSRALGMTVACIGLVACYTDPGDIGDAKTAAELAPSLNALREGVPEYHRRLADGTFDALSLVEQWDFVVEIHELSTKQREAERAEFRVVQRQFAAEFLDSVGTMSPEFAEESLASRREMMLNDLKRVSDFLRMEDSPYDVRTFVFLICLAVTGLGSIGDANTGAELAPSLEPLRDVAPEHYGRLADGTFDVLSFMEQRDFVDEVDELFWQWQEARRAGSDAATRQSIIEFQDSIETLEPGVAEQQMAVWRERLLVSLKRADDWQKRLTDRSMGAPATEDE